jgi:UDP-N-acetylglucosamine diphosphorylase/glucosamine-1-phosphate N-acetyltransferase
VSAPAVFLYDVPEERARFEPFALSRPLGELRYGAYLLRERWEQALGLRVQGHLTAPHLADYTEPGAPPAVAEPGAPDAPRLVLRSSFAPAAAPGVLTDAREPTAFVEEGGTVVGAALPPGTPWPGWAGLGGFSRRTASGRLLEGAWALVRDLGSVLAADLERRVAELEARVPALATVLGSAELLGVEDADIEPHVVFDTRGGPIWIASGASVRSFSRLAGPLFVGPGTRVVGGQLRESAIGPRCVVHGEVSNAVFLGYANKAHDGFLGHSVVGRWVNLGAGTVTSNLKNTYGPVRLNLGAERVETGMTFLGSLIGDHAKTAIGTMLPTGCVIGAGANLFGNARPAGAVPPFAWGTDEPGRLMACRMFLQVAGRVMPRREVELDDRTRRYLEQVWRAGTGRPCD